MNSCELCKHRFDKELLHELCAINRNNKEPCWTRCDLFELVHTCDTCLYNGTKKVVIADIETSIFDCDKKGLCDMDGHKVLWAAGYMFNDDNDLVRVEKEQRNEQHGHVATPLKRTIGKPSGVGFVYGECIVRTNHGLDD